MIKKIIYGIVALAFVLSFTGCDQPRHRSSGETSVATSIPADESTGFAYVLNTNTKKFHKPSCRYVNTIKPSNRLDYGGEAISLIYEKYTPCKYCNP